MRAGGGVVSFSGSLEDVWDPLPVEQAPEAPLIASVEQVRAGHGGMDRVMGLFRRSTLWVETELAGEQHTVRSVQAEGLSWLPVFSSLAQLAAFCQASGRGSVEVSYGTLTGAELLATCLPALPLGTGVLLDPVADHALPLPPVTGIVPDSLAVDRDTDREG